MFIQIFQGPVTDPTAAERLMRRWDDELRGGAPGFLGATAGVTAEGVFIAAARFESPQHAAENGGREQQGAWWNEMEKVFTATPTFHDCSEVDVLLGGGSDAAGFVQVMQRAEVTDRSVVAEVDRSLAEVISTYRPDVLGLVRAWHDDGPGCTELVWFTSEVEARRHEGDPLPDAVIDLMARADEVSSLPVYFDLTRPVLI